MKTKYIKIDKYGHTYYFVNKKMKVLHNEDGPAVILKAGHKYWYKFGRLHREDGPAVMSTAGVNQWFLNGLLVTEVEHAALLN